MADRIYVTRLIPEAGIKMLRQHFPTDVNDSDVPLTANELREKAGQYEALVTLLTDNIDRAVLEAGKGRLKIVANVAVGYDNIDVDAATEFGIMVTNTPGVLTQTTADFSWALLMAVARRVCEGQAFLRAGKYNGWGILMLLGDDIYGKTLGVVGFGRIGQAVVKRSTGFDMQVLYFDPVPGNEEAAAKLGARKTDLDTLLSESDYVSVHAPLSPETHHLIGAPQFARMKRTAYLINTSRGPVVDEAALANALHEGQIKGAALDVFENEPKVHPGLLELPNVLITPHIASASTETRNKMATVAAEDVIAAFEGRRPPTLVNTSVAPPTSP
ncbi:MAG: D-glycerate dehydrogenase [Chloroflexota bacterium]|nr:D-glycerate dehydrogenase [Chloroflexota bacterium]